LHARGLTFSQVSVELMGGSPDAGA